MRPLLLVVAALALVGVHSSALIVEACGQATPKAAPKQTSTASFAEDVFPIFKGRCVDCHRAGGEGYEKSGLDLTTYEGLMKGTKHGPMVIAGDPDSSNLMWLLDWRASPELRMPHSAKKLSVCDRNAMRQWIREGAKNN
jgi:mono/diheme cytochrome c family protein